MRRASLIAVFCLVGCGPSAMPDAGSDAPMQDAPALDAPDAALTLRADAGPNRYAYVDEDVVLDGSASTLAVLYTWNTGDGRALPASSDPVATVRYPAPGRYSAVLTIEGREGTRRTDAVVISVTHRPVFQPQSSSSVAYLPPETASGRAAAVAVAVEDADALAVFLESPDGSLGALDTFAVCDGPRSVASLGPQRAAVSCASDARVAIVDASTREVSFVALPRGSRPQGVIALDGARLAVALQGTGELALLVAEGSTFRVDRILSAIEDARALTLLPDGRVVVSRWRSPNGGGELAVLDLASGARSVVRLAVDPQIASDTEIGGVPNYLESLAVSPDGRLLLVASLQAAIGEGTYRAGRALRFETTVRATLSFVAVPAIANGELVEDFGRRRQFDNRGFASAAVFSERGDFAYVATRGNRTIERYDVLADTTSGSLQDLGYAIQGLALMGSRLFVDASLSRTLRVLSLDGRDALETVSMHATVAVEPLAPAILRGAQLFNDSADPRLSRDGYIACAHCHLDGLDDHRVWDFTDRGEGLRNTVDLSGRMGEGHGPIHWSGNFDELEDFENDIRNAFGGTGLLDDADFAAHADTLGEPKRGLSEDLDALAAYVRTLTLAPSPHRDADGTLTDAAERGRAIFLRPELGCTDCHGGEALTDSAFVAAATPLLHDVGTLGPGSGMRRGGPLSGIDTPTLRGLWDTAPYLHDGSAASLHEVLRERNPTDQHGVTSGLSEPELADLIAYLLCLDGA